MRRPSVVGAGWGVPVAFVALGTLWGSSFLWIKIGIDELPPATLVAYRMALGAAGMLGFLLAIGERLPGRAAEIGHLAVMGAINAGLPIFLISWGEQFVDSGTAAVLNSLVPIFSLVIAGLLIRDEPVTPLRTLGVALGFAGAFVLASRELALRNEPAALLGALAVVLAALSYAAGASYARYRIRSTHRYVLAGGTLLFAAIYTGLLAVFTDGGFAVPREPDTILAVVWLGILGSFVAYLLYFFLLERVGATVSTMVTYVFPVVGVTLGVVFLGEILDWRLLAGTALVVAGIAVVGLRAARSRAAGALAEAE
jgi:drug/metabolite transporter (DMT)-like permease